MITNLVIKNYALIEDIRVDFQSGLTIITGETGAGKSILLGALGLLLGKRADVGAVKDPSKKCVVEGQFSIGEYGLKPVFEKLELDYDGHTIIRRELLPGGKSRAFVNDSPVMLSQLQQLSPYLIDVHSQHETLALASENFQMEIIDVFAGTAPVLGTYQKSFKAFNSLSEKLLNLKNQKAIAAKELDYHSFLFEELKAANLEKTNQSELEETFETLGHAEEIRETLLKVTQIFSEEHSGTLETAKEARSSLGKIKSFSASLEKFWERLNGAIIEMEDLSEEMQTAAAKVEADPERLAQTNESLQTLYKLQQKHSVATVLELLQIQNELAVKIESTLQLDEEIEGLETLLLKEKENLAAAAAELHQKRAAAIPALKTKLETYLKELGMANGRFRFELTASDVFRKSGADSLELLFTANKGLEFGPLKKVASGGEMSRIMLAVKAVLAQYKNLPTVVFDEIDSGVSGEIANKMAMIMNEMSATVQLLTITHLPQIAAKGAQHIKVYKEDLNETTFTRLKTLDEKERVEEIAEMLGGKNKTAAALANARELLN